jgi:bifunctional DNA-binding transcriptional regulator/antitoxin component of YhaV-PrlF toxin-antitoxin module
MAKQQFVEVAADGHLALPTKTRRKLRLGPGMKFKLLTDDDSMLVMRLVPPSAQSSIGAAELRLQQMALAKIWDDPAEDIYNEHAQSQRCYPGRNGRMPEARSGGTRMAFQPSRRRTAFIS